VCPFNGSMIRRPASLHRVRRDPFPGFLSTIRTLRLPADHPAALRCLRLAVPPSHLAIRSDRPEMGQPIGQECFGCGHPKGRAVRWNRRDLPSSWGAPMARSPCSLTPVGQPVPDHFGMAVLPPLRIRRRRQHCAFRGSITPLPSSLCTLRQVDRSTTAQHSLPGAGQALPDRLDYLQGSDRRFQILHLIPLLQAWLGASPNALSLKEIHRVQSGRLCR